MKVIILKEAEIRSLVGIDHVALQAVALGFTRLSEGKVSLPPVTCIDIPENNGEVDIKTAYIQGLDHFAIKVASGFYDNPKAGLPFGSGLMMVLSTRTGFLEGVLLDNGYLTDLRTGIAGAIAARHLAPMRIQTAGVIGSGMQARWQIRGLKLVRDFERLLVYGIDAGQVQEYIQEMQQELGIEVRAAQSPEEVVRESSFVVTTTPSRQAYLQESWLHPGLHITSMGSDTAHKQELHPGVFARADLVACDRRSQCVVLGELHHAVDAGVLSEQTPVIELGELTSGRHPGRQQQDGITVCDLTGVGVQDTAIALLAYEKALETGLGIQMDTQ